MFNICCSYRYQSLEIPLMSLFLSPLFPLVFPKYSLDSIRVWIANQSQFQHTVTILKVCWC